MSCEFENWKKKLLFWPSLQWPHPLPNIDTSVKPLQTGFMSRIISGLRTPNTLNYFMLQVGKRALNNV